MSITVKRSVLTLRVLALDKVAQAYASVQSNVLSPAADKLTAAAGELQQTYHDINDAVCVAK